MDKYYKIIKIIYYSSHHTLFAVEKKKKLEKDII